MKHLDPKEIFFESDRIQVVVVAGDTVTISVKRNNKLAFQTKVSKADFSPHLQQHFEQVLPGAWLTRGSCCFNLR